MWNRIEVIDEFRNKGIATATALHFLVYCMNQILFLIGNAIRIILGQFE